jgi:hypothetical protein
VFFNGVNLLAIGWLILSEPKLPRAPVVATQPA